MLAVLLEQLIDDHVENIIELFKVFSSGTHVEAARIAFPSVVAIRTCVDDGFVHLSHVFA